MAGKQRPGKTARGSGAPSRLGRAGIALAGVGAAALVAVGVVVLHGGTSATAAGSAVVSSGHATTSTPGAPEAVAAGGGYRLASVTGEPVTFPDGRPTLLYFMSASCSSCWQGNSQIAQIYSALRTRAQVVSLDVTPQVDTVSQVQEMAQQTGATWPQAFATSAILNRYHVDYLDTVVVLSPTGKVVYDGGIPSNAKLLALVKGAAGSSAST